MPITARIEITMTDKGEIAVSGPFNNKLLCFGLLEIARDVIRAQAEAIEGKRVLVTPALSLAPHG